MASFLSAEDAAARLEISRATLYAYVSRGMIRSQAVPGSRRREYLADDVERLVARREGRRDPTTVARAALDVHGLPVLSSSLTLIDGGRLYYRGHDVVALATDDARSFEDVVELLWAAPLPDACPPATRASARRRWAKLPFVARCLAYLAEAGAADPAAYHLEPATVRRVGAAIMRGLTGLAAARSPAPPPIAEILAQAWELSAAGRQQIEAALILSADHELNVSAFTARCVASAGATPYMAVSAALAALSGHKHGGDTERVADLLDERGAPRRVLGARLRRGESLPGLGHPLYPEGDPRGRALLELADGRTAAVRRATAIAAAAAELIDAAPNLDFGLVTLARSLDLPRDAPLILFALGRCAGWLAHALEQYERPQLIRPRARYLGPAPET